jgi:phage tail sheath protein FI
MDYSTYNVKKYTNGKWEWASGSNLDGSGKFGAHAQRHMVVEGMQSALSSNDGIRSESVYFNLIAAPGYPELMDEMIALNKDKKEIAFVIGDTPMDLKSDSTSLKNWATDNMPAETYAAVYYPHGLSTDLSGNDVVIPSSAIALRTIAFSDQVSFPWFAPAGLTRGVVTNASKVGFVNDENEFSQVRLSNGQRDTLYTARVNPIADLPNQGLVVYGQKTSQAFASALDRVNVARLVNYMRFNLDNLSRGFLFEQNDKITRDNIRDAVERFCGELVTNRGLFDFLVVCDESNNTPARIDRNELYVDVAIQPVKSVEFIYIPLRIRNTGESLA